jgi:hypothetical protein
MLLDHLALINVNGTQRAWVTDDALVTGHVAAIIAS